MKRSKTGQCQVVIGFAVLSIVLFHLPAVAIDAKPAKKDAYWGADKWGIVKALPSIVKLGQMVHIHAIVVGGSAADPFWSCSQYETWRANGTGSINVKVRGDWTMPYSGNDIFGNIVNIQQRDGGDPPPYGWENRISDTCYCYVDTWGASGGCESREVQPKLFFMMDLMNPREGNVQFATVNSGSGWTVVEGGFEGRVGVSWYDTATDYVYVVTDASELHEDLDRDGLPDAWELAFSPNHSLDDFGGGPATKTTASRGAKAGSVTWVNPYSPSEPTWIAVEVNDWDGDGLSNQEEYSKWLANDLDQNNFPYSPTFINDTSTSSILHFMTPILSTKGKRHH